MPTSLARGMVLSVWDAALAATASPQHPPYARYANRAHTSSLQTQFQFARRVTQGRTPRAKGRRNAHCVLKERTVQRRVIQTLAGAHRALPVSSWSRKARLAKAIAKVALLVHGPIPRVPRVMLFASHAHRAP